MGPGSGGAAPPDPFLVADAWLRVDGDALDGGLEKGVEFRFCSALDRSSSHDDGAADYRSTVSCAGGGVG